MNKKIKRKIILIRLFTFIVISLKNNAQLKHINIVRLFMKRCKFAKKSQMFSFFTRDILNKPMVLLFHCEQKNSEPNSTQPPSKKQDAIFASCV